MGGPYKSLGVSLNLLQLQQHLQSVRPANIIKERVVARIRLANRMKLEVFPDLFRVVGNESPFKNFVSDFISKHSL